MNQVVELANSVETVVREHEETVALLERYEAGEDGVTQADVREAIEDTGEAIEDTGDAIERAGTQVEELEDVDTEGI